MIKNLVLFLWNNYAQVSVISNDISGKWIEFDVTNDIKAFLNGAPNYGWIIMKNDEDSSGRINIAARESISNIPQLELIFT